MDIKVKETEDRTKYDVGNFVHYDLKQAFQPWGILKPSYFEFT